MFLLLVISVAVGVRLLFLVTADSDCYSHYWMLHNRKRNKNKWSDFVQDAVFEGYRGYPSLPHIVVLLFPEKYWLLVGKLLNIVYDILSVIVVYFGAIYLFNILGVRNTTACINYTVSLFALSPILHPTTARLKALGGRTFGSFVWLLFALVLGAYFVSGSWYILLLTLPLGWIIILSSQFAMQNMIFVTLIVSGFYADFIAPLFLLGIFITGYFLPGFEIKHFYIRKLDHYKWYFRNYRKSTTASQRNKIKDIFLYPLYLFIKPKHFIMLTFRKLTYVIAAYSVPVLVVLLYWIVQDVDSLQLFYENKVVHYLYTIMLASVIIFMLTSIKYLSFLGQAERYFEYSIFAIVALFVYYFDASGMVTPQFYYSILLVQILVIIINNIFSNFGTFSKSILNNQEDDDFVALLSCLKKINGATILAIPTKWNFKIAAGLRECSKNRYYFDNITRYNKIDGLKYMEDEHIVLHYPRSDFKYFKKTYGITLVVIDKVMQKRALKQGIDYDFDSYESVFENARYALYSIDTLC